MFARSTLICFTLIASAFASPLTKAEGLVVEVKPNSASVGSIADLTFVASVTNTGSEAVKILKFNTILDEKLPTKSFVVTKDGEAVKFTGAKLSVSLDHLDESSFAVIGAGETVSVTHNPAALYDFASVGTGKFSFTPITNFVIEDAETGKVSSAGGNLSKIDVVAKPVEVEVTSDVQKRELAGSRIERRSKVSCSNSSQASFISASYSESKTLASRVVSYLNSKGASDATYKAYFGTNSISTVTSRFSAIVNENSSSRTLSCTDPYAVCGNGVIAYTLIATTNIYYCSIFYNEVANGNLCSGTSVASRNIRGGTTLHEITHAISGTDDVTYGCSADQALSNSNKLLNADNYNCFATQVFQSTGC